MKRGNAAIFWAGLLTAIAALGFALYVAASDVTLLTSAGGHVACGTPISPVVFDDSDSVTRTFMHGPCQVLISGGRQRAFILAIVGLAIAGVGATQYPREGGRDAPTDGHNSPAELRSSSLDAVPESPKEGFDSSDAEDDKREYLDILRELGQLRDQGILTQDEFELKKAEILRRL